MEGFDWVAVSVAVGALLPLLISFVKRVEWSTRRKQWVATLVSVVVGTVEMFVQTGGALDVSVLLAHVGVVVTVAQATYAMFWEGSSIERSLANVGSHEKVAT